MISIRSDKTDTYAAATWTVSHSEQLLTFMIKDIKMNHWASMVTVVAMVTSKYHGYGLKNKLVGWCLGEIDLGWILWVLLFAIDDVLGFLAWSAIKQTHNSVHSKLLKVD